MSNEKAKFKNMSVVSNDWLMLSRKSEQISTTGLFWANAISNFIILFICKIAVLAFTVSGAEGQTPIAKTSAKLLLCFGWDVVGALLFAGIVVMLLSPVKRWSKHIWPATIFGWAIYAGFCFFLIISIMTQKGVGTPFDKAAIDLAFLNTEANPNLVKIGDEDAIWVSIRPYFNVQTFTIYGLMVASPVLGNGLFYKWVMNGKRWAKRTVAALAIIFAFLTVILLPNLRNGEIMGIRVHTFGLERSHFVSLVSSYLKPMGQMLFASHANIADPYCFDIGSIASPGKLESNPLATPSPDGPVPQKTNLIVIVLESVPDIYHDLTPNPMPLMSKRVGEPGAVALTKHYSTWPQTFKALFSLLCSELPYPDYQPITYINPGIPCVSLIESLKNAGYATGHFNSADLAYDRQLRFYRHRNFDVIYDMYSMPGKEGRWRNNWGIDEAVTIDAMFDWVGKVKHEDQSKPFAAMYALVAGHHPYVYPGSPPPPDTVTEAEYEAHIRCLGYIDRTIQSVLDRLKSEGMDKNTLVLVVADHGEGFLQHPLSKSHGPMVYEEAVHVPAVLIGPQLENVSGEIDFPTSHIDLAPTVLALLNLPIPPTMKGRNLLGNAPAETVIFSGRPPASQLGLRDGKWKYLYLQESGREELYDVEADPKEENDQIEQYPELAAKFQKRLIDWQNHSRNLIENYASILQKTGRRCESTGGGR